MLVRGQLSRKSKVFPGSRKHTIGKGFLLNVFMKCHVQLKNSKRFITELILSIDTKSITNFLVNNISYCLEK